MSLVEMQEIPALAVFPKASSGPPSKPGVSEGTWRAERNDSVVVGPAAFRSVGRQDRHEAAMMFEPPREISN